MSLFSVVCVLKRSSEYDIDYVEHLYGGIAKHLPGVAFRCISDAVGDFTPLKYDWPGWWSKMSIFDPAIKGDLLYFDLDTIITGDLSDIASVGCLTMLSDFYHLERLASGMMFLPEKDRGAIWDEWIKSPEKIMANYRGWGDGGFLNDIVPNAARWQDLLPGQVVSYKAHVRKGLATDNARVVCFHGNPRPRAVGWKL